MKHKTAGGILLGALLIVLTPAVASAHHPIVTGTTQCRVDTWSVTWTARADAARGYTWDVTTAGFTPDGFQSDSLPFTRTVTYPASQTSATQSVSAVWSNQATGSGSATVARPPICEQPTTTTSSTTIPEETTTSTSTTTTTTQPPCVDCTPDTQVTVPDPTTTQPAVTTTAPTTVPAPTDPTTTQPTCVWAGQPNPDNLPICALPSTGSSTGSLLALMAGLLILGTVAVRVARRT